MASSSVSCVRAAALRGGVFDFAPHFFNGVEEEMAQIYKNELMAKGSGVADY
ncbi:MAG: hypothetical protein V4726_01125 [Verrucomicrobiota bacterium]